MFNLIKVEADDMLFAIRDAYKTEVLKSSDNRVKTHDDVFFKKDADIPLEDIVEKIKTGMCTKPVFKVGDRKIYLLSDDKKFFIELSIYRERQTASELFKEKDDEDDEPNKKSKEEKIRMVGLEFSILVALDEIGRIEKFVELIEELGFDEEPPLRKVREEKYTHVDLVFPSGSVVALKGSVFKREPLDIIQKNYNVETVRKMQNIVKYMKDGRTDAGRLLVMHGEAGTGKTYAIRSLISELDDDIAAYVLADPIQFMQNVGLLIQLVSRLGEEKTLIIAEDIGECFKTDFRDLNSQAFSNVLNITDGLLGATSGIYLLMTFNTSIENIDPAIIRVGRTIDKINFDRLSSNRAEEAACQFERNNKLLPGSLVGEFDKIMTAGQEEKDYTLAELYKVFRECEQKIS